MSRLARTGAWIEAHVFSLVFWSVVGFTLGVVIAHWGFGVALPLLADPTRGPR